LFAVAALLGNNTHINHAHINQVIVRRVA